MFFHFFLLLLSFSLLIITSFFLVLRLISELYSFFGGAPFVSLEKEVLEDCVSLLRNYHAPLILDLGCGNGTSLIHLVKNLKGKGIGYEISPILFWRAFFNVKKANLDHKIQICRKNILDLEIPQADIIFIYLTENLLEKLSDQLITLIKNNVTVITVRYQLPHFDYVQKKNSLYPIYLYSTTLKGNHT